MLVSPKEACQEHDQMNRKPINEKKAPLHIDDTYQKMYRYENDATLIAGQDYDNTHAKQEPQ